MTTKVRVLAGRIPHAPALVTGLLIIVLWELIAAQFTPRRFPGLLVLAENFVIVMTNSGEYDLYENISITLLRIGIGASIAIVLAVFWGVLMGVRSDLEDYLSAPLFLLLTFPSVFWAFLAVLWFGLTNLLVPVFVIVLIVFPYLTVNIWEGTKDIDPNLVEMARAFDVSRTAIFRDIYLPHLTPYLFTTTRLGFAVAWKLSLVAEIFGTSTGVGVVIRNYYEAFDTSMVMAWALPIMLLMFGVEQLLQHLEKQSYQWKPASEIETTGGMAE